MIDEIAGIRIPDPYRWLEERTEEVDDWVAAQNTYTDSVLRSQTQKVFSNELQKLFWSVVFSNPVAANGRYFFVERRPGQDQFVLLVQDNLRGKPRVLFDPHGKTGENTATIQEWTPSLTGKYIAYEYAEGGTEMGELRILDVATGKHVAEVIPACRHASVAWLPDDSGFFYTRHPKTGEVPKNEEHLHEKAFFHRLGDAPDRDMLIFGADRPNDDMLKLDISPDGRYLSIGVLRRWTENEIFLYDCKRKKLHPLVVGISAKFDIRFAEELVLLITNYRAENFRILATPYEQLFRPITEWEERIPEQQDLLESAYVTKESVILEYLSNACSRLELFDFSGKRINELPLPAFSTVNHVSANPSETEFFYGVESFSFPHITFRYNPEIKTHEQFRAIENPIDPDNYRIRQEWFTSKDGVNVPMFIFHKKNMKLNGQNPTILYGYGGFGIKETPVFSRHWLPWLERGGIFAIANIRGGGEFGSTWHEHAIKEKKHNSFDDFIAAAEYLTTCTYTCADNLGILGGSNGGLLVSAVAILRPELFAAVCARVPLTDMVRFPRFGMAKRWIHEYGDPSNPLDLQTILSWSPYHNVRPGAEYPSFLFTTAENDTRVDPMHARKMVAQLQALDQRNHILLFTEKEAGHGAGKPLSKIVEAQSLILTFFSKELGLRMN